MRSTYASAAIGMAIAVMFIVPVVLMGASSAHADYSGYSRCVGNIKEVPLKAPDALNMQFIGSIEQDLKSGVSPAAEAQNVARTGFDPGVAEAVVQCVIQNNP